MRNKVKACLETGLHSVLEKYGADCSEAHLLARIEALNQDASIHGILVQMPLPKHIDALKVIEAISTHKDVDGYSVLSAGELLTGLPGFRPCTPFGCMKLIASTGMDLRGKHAVVIGRSNTVGKPMALLLLQANATVTICHSATPDLGQHTRQADVVVAAVGRRNTLTADMVKPGAVVIDVGINRDEQGKLCGDVDFDAVSQVAAAVSPVPRRRRTDDHCHAARQYSGRRGTFRGHAHLKVRCRRHGPKRVAGGGSCWPELECPCR